MSMRATRTLRRLCFAETRGVFKPQVPITARAFPEGADVRPETESLKVAPSLVPGAGLGLYVKVPFRKHSMITEYTGTQCQVDDLIKQELDTSYVIGLSPSLHIDAKDHTHVLGRYINDNGHEESINAEFIRFPEDSKAIVRATRDINAGEEVFCAYGSLYWQKKGFPPARFCAHNETEQPNKAAEAVEISSAVNEDAEDAEDRKSKTDVDQLFYPTIFAAVMFSWSWPLFFN